MSKAVEHFWEWFKNHQSKFKTLTTLSTKEKKQYLYWLDWHLQFYCPGLEFILVFPKRKEKKAQLLIAAKGKQELFKIAIDLEKAAPKSRHWEFTALIQPHQNADEMEPDKHTSYVLQDITLKASEFKFIPLDYDGKKKIDMGVYLRNFTIYTHNKNLGLLINIMIQGLLGEKLIHENINFVQLAQLPEQEEDEVIYLYDLQLYLDDMNIK